MWREATWSCAQMHSLRASESRGGGPGLSLEISIPSDPSLSCSLGEWERPRVSGDTAGSLRASSKPLRPCFAAGTPRGEDTDWVMDRCWSPPGTQPL